MSTQQMKALDPNARLTFLERFAYGLGDYSCNLVYSAISAFLLVYYTDVLGVAATTAGSVMAVSKIFDGVSDLIMGRIVDNTRSKWGKARPWILRMSIPLAVCTVLMFSVPGSLTGAMQIGYIFLSYNLVSTVFYTGLNVPYATLQGLITTNQYERGLLGNFRMLLATFGTMTVNSVVPPLCKFFGGGEVSSQTGWTITFIILMAAFVGLNIFTFAFCKERVVEDAVRSDEKGPSVMECLKSLIRNKYWILMVVFLFTFFFMMSTFFGGNFNFARYVVKDEGSYALLSNSLSMAQMITMLGTPFLMKKLGKRMVAMLGMGINTAAFALTAAVGSNVGLVVACNILKGIGFGCCAATMFGLLQDAITYGQWLTGVQAMGMGNAASSFCMKVGSGLGTAALGWFMGMGGFDIDPTSASSIAALNTACVWVPVVTCAMGVACMVFFDLDKYYDRATSDLNQGKWKGSK